MREFYARAGYRVASTECAHWYVPGQRVWKNFPCGRTILPAQHEARALSRERGMIGIEFYNAHGIGARSGYWVVRDKGYGLHSLQRQFRQRLARAHGHETVRVIGFDELHRLGVAANRDSLARLDYDDPHLSDPTQWRRLCDAGAHTEGAGVVASFGRDGLTGYLIHFVAERTSYGLISKSVAAARTAGSNHALYFGYTRAMIGRSDIDAVTLGVQALPPQDGVDRMKRHAGYVLEPFHVAVLLRPAADALLMSGATALTLEVAERLFGARPALRRTRALRALIGATREGYDARSAAR